MIRVHDNEISAAGLDTLLLFDMLLRKPVHVIRTKMFDRRKRPRSSVNTRFHGSVMQDLRILDIMIIDHIFQLVGKKVIPVRIDIHHVDTTDT